jgi:hypothetical protein
MHEIRDAGGVRRVACGSMLGRSLPTPSLRASRGVWRVACGSMLGRSLPTPSLISSDFLGRGLGRERPQQDRVECRGSRDAG